MSKALFQIQQTIKNLRQQINDVLQLSFLNHQSILCFNSPHKKPLKDIAENEQNQNYHEQNQNQDAPLADKIEDLTNTHKNIEEKFRTMSSLFQKRTQNHLNYLIIKQIQGEQQCVRRDRLNEYQQRIYDQRRLISDKEVFCESLLRPKKQRPEHMTSEQFQEMRARQKVQEQKIKQANLDEEIKCLVSFKKKLFESQIKSGKKVSDAIIIKKQIEMYGKLKNQDLQKTKANSLEVVNLSATNSINPDKVQKNQGVEQLNVVLPALHYNQLRKGESQQQNNHSTTSQTFHSVKSLGKNEGQHCFSVQIQKLIHNYTKNGVGEQAKAKVQKIINMIGKIKAMKQQNCSKNKQWKELQMQNAHMKAHLKKTKELYKLNQANLSKVY